MISFDEIPYDWLEPGTFVEIKPNYRNIGILPWPVKNLIIGQKLAAGTITVGQIVEITRAEEAIALFGLGSVGAKMVAAFKRRNKTQPLFVMAMADAGGAVKATGTLTFTGAVSQDIVLRFKIGGTQVRITVAATDTVTQMAAKLVAAITADTSLDVTAGNVAGVVTCTARHGGEVGNDIDLRVDTAAQPLPSGLGCAVVAMSGGTGNPVLQTSLDLLVNSWFTDISWPWSDATNMAAAATWLKSRYVAMTHMDAKGYVARRGTYGQLGTFGGLTNCAQLSAMGLKNSPTNSWELAASVHAVAAFQLTNDPARQLRSLVVDEASPDFADQFTDTEKDLLLRQGVSTFDHMADGTTVISRLITTYKTSNLGIADRAWLDIMTPATLSRIRYDWSAYVSLLYPRAKLVDDDDIAAIATRNGDEDIDEGGNLANVVVTPGIMKGSWAARCALYGEQVWIEDVKRTVKESTFERNGADKNRMDARQQVKIVGNLMVLAASLEFQV